MCDESPPPQFLSLIRLISLEELRQLINTQLAQRMTTYHDPEQTGHRVIPSSCTNFHLQMRVKTQQTKHGERGRNNTHSYLHE